MNKGEKIKLENLRKIRAYSILAKGDMPNPSLIRQEVLYRIRR